MHYTWTQKYVAAATRHLPEQISMQISALDHIGFVVTSFQRAKKTDHSLLCRLLIQPIQP